MARRTRQEQRRVVGEPDEKRHYSASVDRAARILMALSATPEPLPLPNISQRAGLEKSTAFRILCTLATAGMVAHDESKGTYSLGFLPLRFADAVLGTLRGHDSARSIMHEVRDSIDETVALSIRDGWSRVNVDYLVSTHAVVQTQRIGVPFPLHVGAPGLVILANLDEAAREEYFATEEFGAAAGRDHASSLRSRLEQAVAKGYLVSSGECTPGGTVLAAAIKDASGEVFGALHVAAPAGRWSSKLEKSCATLVVQSARRIAEAMAAAP